MILNNIPTLESITFGHYSQIEEAVSKSSIEEIEKHYAYIHGVSSTDISTVSLWKKTYCYRDASECCPECEELECAIATNIAATEHKELIKGFPIIAKAVLPKSSKA